MLESARQQGEGMLAAVHERYSYRMHSLSEFMKCASSRTNSKTPCNGVESPPPSCSVVQSVLPERPASRWSVEWLERADCRLVSRTNSKAPCNGVESPLLSCSVLQSVLPERLASRWSVELLERADCHASCIHGHHTTSVIRRRVHLPALIA
jgi:hypothetical protein